MAVVIPDEGLLWDANAARAHISASPGAFILFVNDVTIATDTEAGDLTTPGWPGYENGVPTTPDSGFDSGEERAWVSWDEQSWEFNDGSGPFTVYGWALICTDAILGGSKIVMAENFDPPIEMTVTGSEIHVTPKYYVKRPA